MTFQTAKGKTIYPPCSRDSDTIKDLFHDLKAHQSEGGRAFYSAALKTYLLNRTAWEMEGTE